MYFSIVIPVHNVEAYIAECLDSIICQSFVDYEIILVENGSADGSISVCRKYTSDSRIKLLHLDECGVSNARNIGVTQARGQYIWFIDSDDKVSPDSLQCLHDSLKTYSEPDVLIFRHCVLSGNEIQEQSPNTTGFIDRASAVNGLFDHKKWSGFVWNKVYQRKQLGTRPFETSIHMIEDLVFNTTQFLASDNFALINDELYCYRKRENSISACFDEKKLSSFDAYEMILEELRKDGDASEYQFAIDTIGNAKVDFSRYMLTYYYKVDKTHYRKIKERFRKIIRENYKYVKRRKARLAARLILISPWLTALLEKKTWPN